MLPMFALNGIDIVQGWWVWWPGDPGDKVVVMFWYLDGRVAV